MPNLTTLPPRQRRTPAASRGSTGPLARVRRAAAELTPDAIERVAQRVVQLLHHQSHPTGELGSPDLLDAGQLARRLGVTRAWVYENAAQLGAIPLGDGPRPRLRFDLATATEAFQAPRRRNEPVPVSDTPRPRPTRRRRTPSTVPLLPVHEPRTRGLFALLRPAPKRALTMRYRANIPTTPRRIVPGQQQEAPPHGCSRRGPDTGG
jgi:hypothetical protein